MWKHKTLVIKKTKNEWLSSDVTITKSGEKLTAVTMLETEGTQTIKLELICGMEQSDLTVVLNLVYLKKMGNGYGILFIKSVYTLR